MFLTAKFKKKKIVLFVSLYILKWDKLIMLFVIH